MTLNPQVSFPQTYVYVVKLHRDPQTGIGHLAGRLEHVASGRMLQFSSAEELVACLMRDLLLVDATSESGS